MGDACISGELKLPLMRGDALYDKVIFSNRHRRIAVFAKRKGRFPYEVSLVPEHVAKRNVKDPFY